MTKRDHEFLATSRPPRPRLIGRQTKMQITYEAILISCARRSTAS